MFFFEVPFALGELRIGFYRSSCPKAELIVKQQVQRLFNRDKSITPALLRMHFHDCFVRGCDASILIDSATNTSEKNAGANRSVRGYDFIDHLKQILESECPSTVSCADIITLATRDAVALSGGPKYAVPTGRRDGLVSTTTDVDLPGGSQSVQTVSQFFAEKGMTVEEMVVLLGGGHSIGVAHCFSFQRRLSSFNGTPDPTMDPALDSELVKICNSTVGGRVQDFLPPSAFLDQNTSFVLDNEIYKQILLKKGVLKIDQELALDTSTKDFVASFAANGDEFQKSFANAMVKMGKIEVLVGNQGEIRKNCRAFN
ncbi:hypothetical protein PIB30_053377 [Stylosanthes scabra]|uniref:Peroxidase n=1 Tax=Stylosanthes scabra TaxID=79078 RepID=A0ABU6RIU4_9FABA|nr:hypothetical protein [Stylosanthes scabra]